jgi:hypothetical protein
LAGERQLVGRRGDRDARRQQRAPQRRQRAPRRARQHRHPRPRHAADEVGAPELIGDPARLLRGGGEHANGHPTGVLQAARRASSALRSGRTDPMPALARPGQRAAIAAPAARTAGAPAVIDGEHHRLRLDGLHARGIGAAEREHGLVGVARQQHGGRAAPEHAHQLHLLRVEVLRVVDDEVPHPLPLGGEQLGIGRERVERGRYQLGRVRARAPWPAALPALAAPAAA